MKHQALMVMAYAFWLVPFFNVGTEVSTTLNATPYAEHRVEKLRIPKHTSVFVYIFLADGCPICQQYAPKLKALCAKYAATATFVGVFPDPFTTDDEVRTFASKFPCGFAMQRDSAQQLTRRLKARITPEVVIVSAQMSAQPTETVLYRGRIDNQFPDLGKRRSVVTEHDVDDALAAIAQGRRAKIHQTQAVGCTIERFEP
jgi:thiol-disulfide isomerase/thioredoxin